MSNVDMEPWLKNLAVEVQTLTNSKIKEWGGYVNKLGIDDQNQKEWADIFKTELKDFMNDLILDVAQTQETLLRKIETLLKRSEELCKQLSIKMPNHGSGDLGLYKEEKELLTRVTELEEQVGKRLDSLNVLKVRESNVCKRLGKVPVHIKESPLPSADQINEYIEYIEGLEREEHQREKRFREIKIEIIDVARELHFKPTLDFEKMVLCEDDFAFTDSNMTLLVDFHDSIVDRLDRVKNEIEHLRENILELWEKLQQDSSECNQFLEKTRGNSLDTLEALRVEMRRCEELKRANIKVFIERLRGEMSQLWEKCKYSSEQRSLFEYYNDSLYTEDLLTLHDIEINRLKKYYEENKEIFELLEKREQCWNKMIELEDRATAPDRYKNRGGQLLREEKERNALLKRIPKMEDKLLELTTNYEIKSGEAFLYWGEPVSNIIKRSHEEYEQNKKLKLSTRKQQRDQTGISHTTIRTPLKPSMTNLSKFTPIRSSTKKQIATPMSTVGRKRHMVDSTRNGLRTAPSKVITGITKVRLRYSTEKKKRMEKLRRLSKSLKMQSDESMAGAEYNFFKNELTNKNGCRSTLFVNNENCPMSPVTLTPRKLLLQSPSDNTLV